MAEGTEDQAEPAGEELVNVEIALSQDRGFVSRRCPHCEREFKRLGLQVTGNDEATVFTCCYCYETAPRDEWWTTAQSAYIQALIYERVVAPKLRELQGSLEGMETGGLLSLTFEMSGVDHAPAIAPDESASMTRVEFPCHPEEPLRVADEWDFDVACTMCGRRYPVADVRRADTAE